MYIKNKYKKKVNKIIDKNENNVLLITDNWKCKKTERKNFNEFYG
jgi:hypothetical protein